MADRLTIDASDDALEAGLVAARAMRAALNVTESLLAELAEGGAENPELGIVREAIKTAEAAGITEE